MRGDNALCVVGSTAFRRDAHYPELPGIQAQVNAPMAEAMKQTPMYEVAGDADIFPPSHAVELFGLLGGGQRDGGWDGSGRPASRLEFQPGLAHCAIFSDPDLAEVAVRFLDEPPGPAR